MIKLDMIFSQTTVPNSVHTATPRTAGWSEGVWIGATDLELGGRRETLMEKRRGLLGNTGAIIGYRLTQYTIDGNRLLKGLSSTGAAILPGYSGWACDVPQMALQFVGTATNNPNSNRFTCRGIPDSQVIGGELGATDAYMRNINAYTEYLRDNGFGFVGKNLSVPSARVRNINNGVVKLSNLIGIAVDGYMALRGVVSINGASLTGSYRVLAIGADLTYTLEGLAGVSANEGGTARRDEAAYFDYATVKWQRIVVRKVGKPSAGYRGRASKRKG